MRLPTKRIIALEMTPHRVALIEVEPGRRPKVYAWATAEGPFADDAAMAQRIRQALETGGFTARRTYVAPAIPVEHRHLSLPPLSRRELRGVVERETRREMAIPSDERMFDFAVVGEMVERSGARKKDVLLAICSELEVDRYIRIVEQAGLIPWFVTSRPLALMAAIGLQATGGGPVIGVSLQDSVLQVMVVEEGVLHFTREVTLPTPPGGGGVESWGGVTTEIHRSLLYFFERSPRWRVGRIILSGSSDDLEGLREALAQDQTIGVEIFDPKERVEVRTSLGEGPAWHAAVPRLAVPLGLVSVRPEVGIDLLPQQVQERKWGMVRRVAFGAVAMATIVLGSISFIALTRGEQSLRQALQSQVTLLINLEQQVREVVEVERQREMHQARLSLLEVGAGSGPLWRGILREISVQAHPDLLLHALKLEPVVGGYRMVLKGQATSGSPYEAHVAFNRFYEGLRRSPFLVKVTLGQPLKVTPVIPEEEDEAAEEADGSTGVLKTAVPLPERQFRLEFNLALGLNRMVRR